MSRNINITLQFFSPFLVLGITGIRDWRGRAKAELGKHGHKIPTFA